MSWLYTIFFAGLMFGSHGTNTIDPLKSQLAQVDVPAVSVAEETEHFDQTYGLSPGGRVSVSNVNGSIRVEAWDRNEVRIEYTKTADSKERLSDVQVKIDAKSDYVRVESDY